MESKKGKLIIARHGESEWNKVGLFTGKEDVHLSADGFKLSELMGALIKDIHIGKVFTSMQVRSMETEVCMMNSSGQYCPEIVHSGALNERDYGVYTGHSKKEEEDKLGMDEAKKMKRSWDYPIPGGETLKDVYERELPFFKEEILPTIRKGRNVLLVAHGNSLRALRKYVEKIGDQEIENVEMPFNEVIIYELNDEGYMLNKEVRKVSDGLKVAGSLVRSAVNIVATVGPSSDEPQVLTEMIKMGMDVARLNFHWGSLEEQKKRIANIKEVSAQNNIKVPIIADLPGPRIQEEGRHTYDINAPKSLTLRDCEVIKFGVEQGVDYFAMSFAGNKEDILECKAEIAKNAGTQKVIAKIEREVALVNIDEIIEASDAIMIARGDLGNEVPLEKIPFVQGDIVKKCKASGKPVIVATQMLYSMKDNPSPTRAEVTDVVNAALSGADAVMLSEETANGKYPINSVHVMEHILREAQTHMDDVEINNF